MITQERLKEVLDYNPCTGIFVWKLRLSTNKVGEIAGHFDKDGYKRIQIDGKIYRSHRLAWLYVYGNFPLKLIDHIDCVKTNNSISNLREAEPKENNYNTGAMKNNKLQAKGIRKSKNNFQARITGPNGLYTIGSFKTLEEAKEAYEKEALKIHQFFVHHSVKTI